MKIMKLKQLPLISIIIPNRPDRNIICLPSISEQTYTNNEIIVAMDDKLEGAPAARNAGAEKAEGKYLFFCDDDVVLKKDCLEKMFTALQENPDCVFAYCNYKRRGRLTGLVQAQPWDYRLLRQTNYISTMSLLETKEFPGFDMTLKRYQDWDLWLRMGKTCKGVHVPEILFTAFYDEKSISVSDAGSDVDALKIIKAKHAL